MQQLGIGYGQELPTQRLQLQVKFHLAKEISQETQVDGKADQ
jgi:hypothetical protein